MVTFRDWFETIVATLQMLYDLPAEVEDVQFRNPAHMVRWLIKRMEGDADFEDLQLVLEEAGKKPDVAFLHTISADRLAEMLKTELVDLGNAIENNPEIAINLKLGMGGLIGVLSQGLDAHAKQRRGSRSQIRVCRASIASAIERREKLIAEAEADAYCAITLNEELIKDAESKVGAHEPLPAELIRGALTALTPPRQKDVADKDAKQAPKDVVTRVFLIPTVTTPENLAAAPGRLLAALRQSERIEPSDVSRAYYITGRGMVVLYAVLKDFGIGDSCPVFQLMISLIGGMRTLHDQYPGENMIVVTDVGHIEEAVDGLTEVVTGSQLGHKPPKRIDIDSVVVVRFVGDRAEFEVLACMPA